MEAFALDMSRYRNLKSGFPKDTPMERFIARNNEEKYIDGSKYERREIVEEIEYFNKLTPMQKLFDILMGTGASPSYWDKEYGFFSSCTGLKLPSDESKYDFVKLEKILLDELCRYDMFTGDLELAEGNLCVISGGYPQSAAEALLYELNGPSGATYFKELIEYDYLKYPNTLYCNGDKFSSEYRNAFIESNFARTEYKGKTFYLHRNYSERIINYTDCLEVEVGEENYSELKLIYSLAGEY